MKESQRTNHRPFEGERLEMRNIAYSPRRSARRVLEPREPALKDYRRERTRNASFCVESA
jgi:hypothetical protein